MSFDDSPYDEVQEAVALLVDLVGRPERGASTPSRLRRRGAVTGPAPPPPRIPSRSDSIPSGLVGSTAEEASVPLPEIIESSPVPALPAVVAERDEAGAHVVAKAEPEPEATPEPEAETEQSDAATPAREATRRPPVEHEPEPEAATEPTATRAPASSPLPSADATTADTAPMASWTPETAIPEPTASDPRTAEVPVTTLHDEPSAAKPDPDTEPILTDLLSETPAPKTEAVVPNLAVESNNELATDEQEPRELDGVRLDAVTRELPKPEATPVIDGPPAAHEPIALSIEDDDEDDWHETDLDETAAGWTGAATQAPRDASDATPKTPDDLPPETTKNYFQSRIGARRKDNPSS